jgi:hypothetical protein
VAVAIDRDETNTAIFGPLLQLGNDKAALTLNLLFEQTFGQNREVGTTLAYAAGLKRELKEGIAIGIESHGRIPDIAEAPGIDWQEHRIGPVLYLEDDVGSQSGAAKGGKLFDRDRGLRRNDRSDARPHRQDQSRPYLVRRIRRQPP